MRCKATHRLGGADDAPEVRCKLAPRHDGPHVADQPDTDFTATWHDAATPPAPPVPDQAPPEPPPADEMVGWV
jgi:hypothetical protein